jgi:hypothetical protein
MGLWQAEHFERKLKLSSHTRRRSSVCRPNRQCNRVVILYSRILLLICKFSVSRGPRVDCLSGTSPSQLPFTFLFFYAPIMRVDKLLFCHPRNSFAPRPGNTGMVVVGRPRRRGLPKDNGERSGTHRPGFMLSSRYSPAPEGLSRRCTIDLPVSGARAATCPARV